MHYFMFFGFVATAFANVDNADQNKMLAQNTTHGQNHTKMLADDEDSTMSEYQSEFPSARILRRDGSRRRHNFIDKIKKRVHQTIVRINRTAHGIKKTVHCAEDTGRRLEEPETVDAGEEGEALKEHLARHYNVKENQISMTIVSHDHANGVSAMKHVFHVDSDLAQLQGRYSHAATLNDIKDRRGYKDFDMTPFAAFTGSSSASAPPFAILFLTIVLLRG